MFRESLPIVDQKIDASEYLNKYLKVLCLGNDLRS